MNVVNYCFRYTISTDMHEYELYEVADGTCGKLKQSNTIDLLLFLNMSLLTCGPSTLLSGIYGRLMVCV